MRCIDSTVAHPVSREWPLVYADSIYKDDLSNCSAETYDGTAGLLRALISHSGGHADASLRKVLTEDVIDRKNYWTELPVGLPSSNSADSAVPRIFLCDFNRNKLIELSIYKSEYYEDASRRIEGYLDKLRYSVDRINRIASELNEPLISRLASRTCLQLAETALALVQGDPDFEMVVAPEEEGGASLVAHSFATQRRFSILTSSGGELREIIQVDERLGVQSAPLKNPQQEMPGLIRWLRNRA